MLMPEELTRDVERKSSLNEMCRERMAQNMRATPYCAHLRLVERASNDVVHNGTLPKRQVCPVVPDENLAGVGGWPPAAEIRGDAPPIADVKGSTSSRDVFERRTRMTPPRQSTSSTRRSTTSRARRPYTARSKTIA
jgi:hypothetical protein